jgi:hypothetical protein
VERKKCRCSERRWAGFLDDHEALVRAGSMRLVSLPENAHMSRDELVRRAEEAVRAA